MSAGSGSVPLVLAEQMLAGLKDPTLAGLGSADGVFGLGLGLQVVEVRLAERTLDDVDVEFEIRRQFGVESIEQEATELLAARAGQPGAVPDGAQGVQLAIGAVLTDFFESGLELGRVAQAPFPRGRIPRESRRRSGNRGGSRHRLAAVQVWSRSPGTAVLACAIVGVWLALAHVPDFPLHDRSTSAQLFEGQPGAAGHLLEPGDRLELVAGHGLLGQIQDIWRRPCWPSP